MARFDTAAPDRVEVTLTVGNVHIITGTRNQASVVVNAADPERDHDVEAAARATVELADGRLLVDVTEPRRLGKLMGPGPRTGAVDIVIEVPDDVALAVTAPVTTVRVDGQLGRTEIRTSVGSIQLDRTGDVVAKTSGGDVAIGHIAGQARVQGMGTIRLGTLTGPAEVKNLTGPVEIGSVEGALRLRSSTGDLVIGAANSDLDVRTANGSITVGMASAGVHDLRTASGTIRIGVPEGTSVLLDATTKLGRVEQQLGSVDGPAPTDRRAEIRAHTSLGDIVVHRA